MSTDTETTVSKEEATRQKRTGYLKSFQQWLWSPSQEQAERDALSVLPFFPESDGTREAHLSQVSIGNNEYINQFKIQNTAGAPSLDKTMVVMHGYGAGLAFFYRNFDAWSREPGSTTYALDWLGFGRSSRPRFKTKVPAHVHDEDGVFPAVVETENFFVDSLERWRVAAGIDKFTLMGHSLGGYLSCVYAMKYPEHVDRLILVSPAGVEYGYTPELETKKYENVTVKRGARLEEELTVTQDEIHHEHGGPKHSSYNTREWTLPKPIVWLWNRHVSPFTVVRLAAPLGPQLVSSWTYRRFNDLPTDEMERMHMYAYRTFRAKPSGELGLTRLLAPGAVPRMPLLDRAPTGLKCPSLWIYGDSDWMNVWAGRDVVDRINKVGDAKAEFNVVPEAGHHTYLDNPEAFDRVVLKWLNRSPVPSLSPRL